MPLDQPQARDLLIGGQPGYVVETAVKRERVGLLVGRHAQRHLEAPDTAVEEISLALAVRRGDTRRIDVARLEPHRLLRLRPLAVGSDSQSVPRERAERLRCELPLVEARSCSIRAGIELRQPAAAEADLHVE
jgi:hypothetical protein